MTRSELLPGRHRMRRAGFLAIAAVLAATLSACVGIPNSGPVIAGREVSEQEQDGFVIIPDGPVEGADQAAILRGFITAFSGSGNFEVAREFLSTDFKDEWDPRESVVVRTSNPRLSAVDATTMEASVVTKASVDAAGIYTAFTPAPQTFRYQFVQEDDEWRISAAPDGIILSSNTFGELFSEQVLYFLDPARESLVPDLRWFPLGTAATRVVSALLAGPPSWLQGAVGTAFPDGTQLTSPKRVAVESNVAVVNLTPEALAADETQRQLMRVQLEASLSRVANIGIVDISVDGTPLTIPDMGSAVPQPKPQVDNRLLVLKDGEFGYYANDQVAPIADLSAKVVATEPRNATLNASGTAAATLGAGGVYLVRARAAEPLLIDQRPGLIAPSLDEHGYVWSAQAADPTSIRAFDSDGVAHDVAVSLPAGSTLVSLTVSRDGARIALLLDTSAGPRLIVSAITRDANNGMAPITIGEPKLDIIADAGDAIDATWMDELSVATLTGDGEQTSIVVYTIGGEHVSRGATQGGVAIIGGNGIEGLRVLGEDGVVSARRGSGWQRGQAEVAFVATQR